MTDTQDDVVPSHDRRRADRYLASGAWTPRTTSERLRAACAEFATNDAVAGPDGLLTYRDLDERTDTIAAGLIEAGLPIGGPVVVQVNNSTESVLAYYALLKAGAVPVAALPAHRSHEIQTTTSTVRAVGHLVDATAAGGALIDVARANAAAHPSVQHLLTVGPAPDGFQRLLDSGRQISRERARALVDSVQAKIHYEDVAVFQLSGGTTGSPKLIPRIHAEYWNNALFNSRALGRTSESRIAHVLPLLHNAGMINALFGAHVVGGCFIALPFGDPAETLHQLIVHRANDMMIGGPMASWLQDPLWDQVAESLELVIFSGSKLPQALFDACTARGIWMGQTWGMAEGPYTSTRRVDPPDLRAGTVGTPVYGADDEMMIVDPASHEPLPLGETGMLVYRGPSTLAGYFDSPADNKVAFTRDGLLLTGDLAKITERGGVHYLSIEGRIKDVISRGGEKFSTEEVEKLLVQHPAIDHAAVVAMPDERLGERACAYVVIAPGSPQPDLTDVQRHFESLGVAKYKWPERLESIGVMPRTATFKIDKVLLRKLAAGKTPTRDV